MKTKRRPTEAEIKAVWDKMEAAGEKPSLRSVAARVSAEFEEIDHKVVQRAKKRGWRPAKKQARTPKQQADTNLNTAVAKVEGKATATVSDILKQPVCKAAIAAMDGKSGPELITEALRAMFTTFIAVSAYAQDMIAQGRRVMTQIEEDKVTRTVEVREPLSPSDAGSLLQALSGSFAVATEAAPGAQAAGMKDVTPTGGPPTIEGTLADEQNAEFEDIMDHVRTAAARAAGA